MLQDSTSDYSHKISFNQVKNKFILSILKKKGYQKKQQAKITSFLPNRSIKEIPAKQIQEQKEHFKTLTVISQTPQEKYKAQFPSSYLTQLTHRGIKSKEFLYFEQIGNNSFLQRKDNQLQNNQINFDFNKSGAEYEGKNTNMQFIYNFKFYSKRIEEIETSKLTNLQRKQLQEQQQSYQQYKQEFTQKYLNSADELEQKQKEKKFWEEIMQRNESQDQVVKKITKKNKNFHINWDCQYKCPIDSPENMFSKVRMFNQIKRKFFSNLKGIQDKQIVAEDFEKFKDNTKKIISSLETLLKQAEKDKFTFILQLFQRQNLEESLNKNQEKIFSLEYENAQQNLRYSAIQTKFTTLANRNEQLQITLQDIQSFHQELQKMKVKFPEYTLDTLMNKYEMLETKSLELVEAIQHLEINQLNLQQENTKFKAEHDTFISSFNYELQKKTENIEKLQQMINNDKSEEKQFQNYKESYLILFNKVFELYNIWVEQMPTFNPSEYSKSLQMSVSDPIELINVMKKMTKTTTQQSTYTYLRQIIVSANQLMKKFFKLDQKYKYSPELVYEKISLLIQDLQKKNQKLNEELTNIKSQFKNLQRFPSVIQNL